jgi:6-phosphogluconolactonase/glucosamine-6-phosphate isomerase/deaminase
VAALLVFFEKLSKPPYDKGVSWSNVNLFWGDERCVPQMMNKAILNGK